MNAFQELIKKAAPIMAAVQSLFLYVTIFSVFGYYVDKKFKTFPIFFIIYELSRTDQDLVLSSQAYNFPSVGYVVGGSHR